MKGFRLMYLGLFLILAFNSVMGQKTRPIIIIDPGHGGVDSGAIGVNGISEKDIVLEVAKEMIHLNKELLGNKLDIYLTRYKDTLISLGDRTKLAKALRPVYFVSIHCNHAKRKAAQGIEVYIQQPTSNTDMDLLAKSEDLAQKMLKEFQSSLGYKIRGRKYANFQVLRESQNICPAVLLELGFLSNWEEAEHLKMFQSITAYALVVLNVTFNYFER